MRAVIAFFGAGIMDRYPNIRYCILKSGFGWLPFWGARMDDQSVYMSYALPDNLARKPSEYMTSGRFFASVVIHEGEKMGPNGHRLPRRQRLNVFVRLPPR